jgi:hypothetical protein
MFKFGIDILNYWSCQKNKNTDIVGFFLNFFPMRIILQDNQYLEILFSLILNNVKIPENFTNLEILQINAELKKLLLIYNKSIIDNCHLIGVLDTSFVKDCIYIKDLLNNYIHNISIKHMIVIEPQQGF